MDEFAELGAQIEQWCVTQDPQALDFWIDDAHVRLLRNGPGVSCSIELLSAEESADPRHLQEALRPGAASLACDCIGTAALDPQTQCLSLLCWLTEPCSPAELLDALEQLANQRDAWLSLIDLPAVTVPMASLATRTTLSSWQKGIINA